MLANPLGDIGLRSHHALIERTLPGESKILVLAIGGIADGTDGQDNFNHRVLDSNRDSIILRPIHRYVSYFRQDSGVAAGRNRHISAAKVSGALPTFPRIRFGRSARWALPHLDGARKDSDAYKITGLDIQRERAMFRKYGIICPGFSGDFPHFVDAVQA
jgi:hypothetical protein